MRSVKESAIRNGARVDRTFEACYDAGKLTSEMIELLIPRRKILFFDWRDIACGTLKWTTPDGRHLGVELRDPPPQVECHADASACAYGVRLAAQPARKIEPYREWLGWGRIIYDEGRYRTWHLEVDGHSKLCSGCPAHQVAPNEITIVAEESNDGFEWRTVARCDIDVTGQQHYDSLTFMIDDNGKPEERYKIVYSAWPPDDVYERLMAEYAKRPACRQDPRTMNGRPDCLYAATSPDGLNWTAHHEPLALHMSDTDTSLFYDEWWGRYVMYVRISHNGGRAVGRMESHDFWHWGPIHPVLWPRLHDPVNMDVYLNAYSTYPDLPECRLMFPNFYDRFTEQSQIRLYSSIDGIAWDQVPGSPVIVPGEPGEWDSEFICGGKDLVPFDGGDKIAIPYAGTAFPHKYPRWPNVYDAWRQGWAWWPKDRLCAVTADRQGEFHTVEIVPAGREMRLNFRTPRGGEVRVGIDGVEGHSVDDCDPMHGDCTDRVVTWNGISDIGVADGRPVTLHFKLRSAELFAVEWV